MKFKILKFGAREERPEGFPRELAAFTTTFTTRTSRKRKTFNHEGHEGHKGSRRKTLKTPFVYPSTISGHRFASFVFKNFCTTNKHFTSKFLTQFF